MSETDETEDIEAIRERKREELQRKATTPDGPVHVESREQFESLTADHHVVLVDFYADWCGPCKMLAPTLETIAADTDAVVAKVDVDQHQALAGEFGVQGVPTLVLFVDGEQQKQLVGVQDEATLKDLVEG